jgi:ubiquinone/menaquinone biosynthesis C-methylase UbiE
MMGHEFSDVDRTGRAGEFVGFLDECGSQEFFHFIERRITDRLEPHPGGRYLDVGCGTGDDVRGLAAPVGPTGEVVGVDSSETMIAEAEKRAEGSGLPVTFQQADAHHLPFADETFDGCRIERVLQHLADPQQAVREMARVTRSGGRVVAFEPDWGTGTVDADDRAVTRAVLNYRCDSIRSGWVGRQLSRLYRRAGLTEVTVETMTSTQTDHARWMALFEIEAYARRAEEARLVTAEAVEAWLAQLAQAGQEGTFFAAQTAFLVSARKP